MFVAVNHSLTSHAMVTFNSECEIVWANIQRNKWPSLYVGSFYRSPTSGHDRMTTLEALSVSLSKVTQRSTLHDIILTDEFNLPDIEWETGTVRNNPQYSTTINQRAVEIMTYHHFTQLNPQPTRFDHILDLLLTSNPSLIMDMCVQPGMSDHDVIMTTVKAYPQRTKMKPRTYYQYKKAVFADLKSDLAGRNSSLNHTDDAAASWNDLKEDIIGSTNQHVPQKKVTTRWNLDWMTPRIKRLTRRKQRLGKWPEQQTPPNPGKSTIT